MFKLLRDRTGGTLEKAIIWAVLLGGFTAAWFGYVKPHFDSSMQRQGEVLDSANGGGE